MNDTVMTLFFSMKTWVDKYANVENFLKNETVDLSCTPPKLVMMFDDMSSVTNALFLCPHIWKMAITCFNHQTFIIIAVRVGVICF